MKEKRKLLYILHDIAIGGVEVALLSAIPELSQKYNLKVVVLGKIDPKNIARLNADERQVFEVFDYPRYVFPLRLPTIIKFILDFNPELMICSLWRASMVASIVKKMNKNIRLFAFNHSTQFSHFFQSYFIKMAARSADIVLTDSVATSLFVKTFSVTAQILEVSFLTDDTPDAISRRAPQLDEPITFMFLGRINPVKNLPLIIKVIYDLRQRSVPAILDVYGRSDGPMSEITSLITKLKLEDHVRFKGEIESSSRKSLFDRYHFYIQLSSREGMAMSVAEAMQHGLVCVVSPVGEIIHYSKDMESAIFIDIHQSDLKNAAGKIIEVINNPELYKKLSDNCHSTFQNKKRYSESLIDRLEQSM
nr:glycosyltransferase family 4 protein [uncultured Dyadobacter sp.]